MPNYKGSVQGAITFHGNSSAEFRLLWIIPDYLQVKEEIKQTEYIELEKPVPVIPGHFSCGLRLYPNGEDESSSDGTSSSSIDLVNCGSHSVLCGFKISLVDENLKQQQILRGFEREVLKPGNRSGWTTWFGSNCVQQAADNVILPQGCLQILVVGTAFTIDGMPESALLDKSILKNRKVSFDISFLNLTDQNSDAILSVGEEKFHVHKKIISKRSFVFQALFKSQSQNIIVIPDISAEAFRQVLLFIYTDSVTAAIDVMLPEVLMAAHKYEIDYLKELCQVKMIKNISVTNAVEYLRAGDELDSFLLKEKGFDFITRNRIEVSKEESWKSLKSERGELLIELIDRFMNQKLL